MNGREHSKRGHRKVGRKPVQRQRPLHCGFEYLEQRLVLSGVTVITHGFSPTGGAPFLGYSPPDWTVSMAQAIVARSSESGKGNIFVHQTTGEGAGSWVPLEDFDEKAVDANGNPWRNSNRAQDETVLIYNWAWESNDLQDGWLAAAADNLFASLVRQNDNLDRPFSETSFFELAKSDGRDSTLNLHFIGHSRGAVLNSVVTNLIGVRFPDYKIDQVTSLDPHPGGPFLDPGYSAGRDGFDSRLSTYENVVFADNYYRQDESGRYEPELSWKDGKWWKYEVFDFAGVSASGALNARLPEDVLSQGGYQFLGAEHSDVHLWYYGTITSALDAQFQATGGADRNSEDGDVHIPGDGSWYGPDVGERDTTGFYYTRIAGGDRPETGTASQNRTKVYNAYPSGVFNGDFEFGYASPSNHVALELPGWERHDGEFDARLSSGRLELSLVKEDSEKYGAGKKYTFSDQYAKHNPLYFPPTTRDLAFDWEVNGGDIRAPLEIRIGDTLVYSFTGFTDGSWAIGQKLAESIGSFAGSVNTLEFRLVDRPSSRLQSPGTVSIDNIRLLQGPVAVIGSGRTDVLRAQLGSSLLLDATRSYDPDSPSKDGTASGLSYAWDLDNDGQFDDAQGKRVLLPITSSDTFTVGLEVTDSDGYTDTAFAKVSVYPLEIHSASFEHGSISPRGTTELAEGASITFTAKPDDGYVVDAWYYNSDTPAQKGGSTFTLRDVTSDGVVQVSFKKEAPTEIVIDKPKASPYATSGNSVFFRGTAPAGTDHITWSVPDVGSARVAVENGAWSDRVRIHVGTNTVTFKAWASADESGRPIDTKTFSINRSSDVRTIEVGDPVTAYIGSGKTPGDRGAGSFYVGYDNTGYGHEIGLAQFNFPKLPPGATVVQCELRGYSDGEMGSEPDGTGSDGSIDIMVQQVYERWSRKSVDWNTRPRVLSNNRVSDAVSLGETATWDITPFCQDWVRVPERNYGVQFSSSLQGGPTRDRYFQKDKLEVDVTYRVETNPPRIDIDTPVSDGRVFTTANTITLEGTAYDTKQLKRVVWQNITTGERGTAADPENWRVTFALAPGVNRVELEAEDASGNTTSKMVDVVYLGPVVAIQASVDLQRQIAVSWEELAPGIQYEVSRSDSVDGPKTVVRTWSTARTFVDSPPEFNRDYFYWVRAASDATETWAGPYGSPAIGRALGPDRPVLSIFAKRGRITEGDSGVTPLEFEIRRQGDLQTPVTVHWTVGPSSRHSAGSDDFGGSLPSGSVTFGPSETSQTVTLYVSGDRIVESDEEFVVSLASPNGDAILAVPNAHAVIDNDDERTASSITADITAVVSVLDRGRQLFPQSLDTPYYAYREIQGGRGTITKLVGLPGVQSILTVPGDVTFAFGRVAEPFDKPDLVLSGFDNGEQSGTAIQEYAPADTSTPNRFTILFKGSPVVEAELLGLTIESQPITTPSGILSSRVHGRLRIIGASPGADPTILNDIVTYLADDDGVVEFATGDLAVEAPEPSLPSGVRLSGKMTIQTGRVHLEGNAIWNNKVYISWQNIRHIGEPDSSNMVIDTWKVDDNGDGDPRNDQNRIRNNHRDTTANGIWAHLARYDSPGIVGGMKSGVVASPIVNEDGSVTLTLAASNDVGSIETSYTIMPNDANLYGTLTMTPQVKANFFWGIYQIGNVYVSGGPGELTTYDRLFFDGQTYTEPTSATSDTLTRVVAGPNYSALISQKQSWASGIVLKESSRPVDMTARRIPQKYNWAHHVFLHAASAGLPANEVFTAQVIFRADGDLSMAGFERTLSSTVNPVDSAPKLRPIERLYVTEGARLNVATRGKYREGQAGDVTFSLDPGAPDGAHIDPVTGKFSWTPAEHQGPRDYRVTVRARNSGQLKLEAIETFTISVLDPNPWQNNAMPFDVNDDEVVSPVDALFVITYLTTTGAKTLDGLPLDLENMAYVDTNGDGVVSPVDVLFVVDYLQNAPGDAEGEGRPGVLGYGAATRPSSPTEPERAGVADQIAPSRKPDDATLRRPVLTAAPVRPRAHRPAEQTELRLEVVDDALLEWLEEEDWLTEPDH